MVEWSIDELCEWIRIHCPDYDSQGFRKEHINGKAFLTFTQNELREDLNVPLGIAKILITEREKQNKLL